MNSREIGRVSGMAATASKTTHKPATNGATILLIAAALIGVVFLTLTILPLLEPLGWALVVTITMWPLFLWMQKRLKFSRTLASTVATLILALGLTLAVVPISIKLTSEAATAIERADLSMVKVREGVKKIPVFGEALSSLLPARLTPPPKNPPATLDTSQPVAQIALQIFQFISNTLFVLGVAIFLSFFMFLHGTELARKSRWIILRLGGSHVAQILTVAYQSVLSTVYGTVATAVAQAILCGIGFIVVGAPMPYLLAFAAFICSLIPFGPALIYLPVAAHLAFVADRWEFGLGLAAWGLGVVSVADNVLRPLFIAQSSEISAGLIFIGVVGGVLAFGAVGIFLGPVIIALARFAWVDLLPQWIPEVKVPDTPSDQRRPT